MILIMFYSMKTIIIFGYRNVNMNRIKRNVFKNFHNKSILIHISVKLSK